MTTADKMLVKKGEISIHTFTDFFLFDEKVTIQIETGGTNISKITAFVGRRMRDFPQLFQSHVCKELVILDKDQNPLPTEGPFQRVHATFQAVSRALSAPKVNYSITGNIDSKLSDKTLTLILAQ